MAFFYFFILVTFAIYTSYFTVIFNEVVTLF